MRDLVELDSNRNVIGVWLDYPDTTDPQSGVPLTDPPQPPLLDVTGRSDVPNRDYRGRRHNVGTDTFGPPPAPPPPSKREKLRGKASDQWTVEDLADWLKNE